LKSHDSEEPILVNSSKGKKKQGWIQGKARKIQEKQEFANAAQTPRLAHKKNFNRQ
jgi:hypothetical protein